MAEPVLRRGSTDPAVRDLQEALSALEQQLGDRLERGTIRGEVPGAEDALASVSPMSAEEVELLAQVAARYSVPLLALGAGTAPESGAEKRGFLVRFDLMRRTRLPEEEEPWVEAEPGVPWLQLDDELRVRGRGLAVYPTSAPRATLGGWLATDGNSGGDDPQDWMDPDILDPQRPAETAQKGGPEQRRSRWTQEANDGMEGR